MPKEITRDTVLDSLMSVVDPEFDKDVVTLGFVKDVRVRGGDVRVSLELATPLFPNHEKLKEACTEQIRTLGASNVEFHVTSLVRGRRAPEREQLLKEVKNVVAVASGKGGVGKSTLSTNLALVLARGGASVGLLDADVYGPSMGMMLGATGRPQMAGENRLLPIESHGLKLMSMAFLATEGTPVIWRGPMVHGLIQQFLSNVEWGALDYLVIDLPPGTGDAQLTLTQTAPLSGAVIITTPQDVSLIDARRGLRMFQEVNVPVLGIVENMSYFACPHCGERSEIFRHGGGKRTSQELGVPFLGEIPIDPEVVLGGDLGSPIILRNPASPAAAAYADVAERVAFGLARLTIEEAPLPGRLFVDWEKD